MRGFSLIQFIIVMIIVSVLVAIALPSYFTSSEQAKARTAEGVLMSISAAQEKLFEDTGNYSLTASPALFSNLNLNVSTNDPYYNNYSCAAGGVVAGCSVPYKCTTNDGTVTLSLTLTMTAAAATPPCQVTGSTVACTGGGSNCP